MELIYTRGRYHLSAAFARTIGALFSLLLFSLSAYAQCPTLVWQDEFSGTSLDLTKWDPIIGDGCDIALCGWGNNELQYYKAENATVSDGTLKITAKKERVRGSQYTSVRLRNMGLERIDLLQIHCPPTDVYYRPEIFETFDQLIEGGCL